jgi:dTDP-4-dehydrorhamnose reductase
MRVLLLGANGQVGFELHSQASGLGELLPASRDGRLIGGGQGEVADLAQPGQVVALIERLQPDVVINAAAYTAVDRAEDEPAQAQRINAEAVAEIAVACRARDALLLHFSTDYVFDGSATRPYREDDATAPLGVYGSSKLAGELAIADSGCRHLIFRTAWVYAARGSNFLKTMLRVGAEREQLRVVADQRGSPTPARWIAAVATCALARGGADMQQRRILNLVASGETSWHGFAEAIFEDALQAGLLARAPQVQPIASGEYPTRATRPAYSRLDCSALADSFDLRLPDWREGLRQVIGELTG